MNSDELFSFGKIYVEKFSMNYFSLSYISQATQLATTCSKLTIEVLEQGVKHVQS